MIGFTIEGAPVPKGRPRFTRTGHTFTPAKTRQYEALVTARAREAMIGKRKIEKPNAVRVDFSLCSLYPHRGRKNAVWRLCKVSSITSQSRTLTTCRRRSWTA